MVRLPTGSLHLTSLFHPLEGRAGATKSIRIFLSRDKFADIAELLDASNLNPPDSALSQVLVEYICTIERFLGRLQFNELSIVAESFTQLLTAALDPISENLHAAEKVISKSRLNLARRFIQRNLTSPTLNSRTLIQALGVSRRQLYYLFERHGGIANYIRRMRLAASCRAIADAADNRLISSIAYSYGYLDPTLFSRQFQAEFGFSPTEAREAKLTGHMPTSTPPSSFSEWLLQVREN